MRSAAAVPLPPPCGAVVLWSVVAVVAAVCFLVFELDSERLGWFSYVLVSFGCSLRYCFTNGITKLAVASESLDI